MNIEDYQESRVRQLVEHITTCEFDSCQEYVEDEYGEHFDDEDELLKFCNDNDVNHIWVIAKTVETDLDEG